MPSSIMYSCREVSELLFERGFLRKLLGVLLAAAGLLGCSGNSRQCKDTAHNSHTGNNKYDKQRQTNISIK